MLSCSKDDCPRDRNRAYTEIRTGSCGHCRATFSTQSFSTTYYLKRPQLPPPILHRILAGSGYRQLSREARCAHSTVVRQVARLARHATLELARHRRAGPIREPLVIDGLESFAHSQYQPLHLNLVVGADSHYQYGLTLARLRRKGRMTAAQRRTRVRFEDRHGRPDPRAIEQGMAAALQLAVPAPQPLTIRSDEHADYPRALKQLTGCTLRHECTPSVQARTTGNPLFPVNLADLLLRHNSANHKRETIAFSKRHQGVVDRALVAMWWRNFCKPFSENHGGGTPAMRRGIQAHPVSIKCLLAKRLFRDHIELAAPWDEYYLGGLPTPGITNPRRHTLKLAF